MTAPQPAERPQCGTVAVCTRPRDHRGHHGGFRRIDAAAEPISLLDSWFTEHETLTRWQYAGLVGDSEKAADYRPSDAAAALGAAEPGRG